jgi:hypothetical protein
MTKILTSNEIVMYIKSNLQTFHSISGSTNLSGMRKIKIFLHIIVEASLKVNEENKAIFIHYCWETCEISPPYKNNQQHSNLRKTPIIFILYHTLLIYLMHKFKLILLSTACPVYSQYRE